MAFGQKPHLLLDHPESAVERPRRCAFKRSQYRRVIIVGCGLAATGMFTPSPGMSMHHIPGDKRLVAAERLVLMETPGASCASLRRGADNESRPSHSNIMRFDSPGLPSNAEWPQPGNTISSEARSLRFRWIAELRLTVQSRAPHTSSIGTLFTRRIAVFSLTISAYQHRITQRTWRRVLGFRRPTTISCRHLSTTRLGPPYIGPSATR